MMRALRFTAMVKADDFVVADHRVHGVRMMPGVTFLDMVWRLLRAKGFEPAQTEIVHVLFMQPVTVADGQTRELAIEVDADNDGWSVVARSRLADDPVDDSWSENFRCRVRFLPKPTLAISSPWTSDEPATYLAMDEVYARARAVDIEHRAGMRMVGNIRRTATTAEATLTLTEQASAFEDDYIVHPAMLDSATLIPFVFRAPGEVDRPYIPLSIERVTLAGPVRGEMLVRVRHDANSGGARDVLFHDYDICAPDGRVLVRVERLSAKRVRHRFDAVEAAVAVTPPMPAPSAIQMTASSAVSEAALRDWLTRYMSSVLGRPIATDAIEVGFYDLGLDSRQLLEAVRVLERGLGVDLYPTLLFEQGSIGRLAAYLWAEHRAGAERLLAAGADIVESVPEAAEPAASSHTLYMEPRWSTAALAPKCSLAGPLLLAGQAFDVRWPGGFTADAKKAAAALFVWRGRQDVATLLTLAGRLSADATLVVAHGGEPEGSALRGLLAGVVCERPTLRLVCIERAGVKDLVNLTAEFDAAAPGFVAVRYRGGVREALGFVEAEFPRAAPPAGGCWLITGGLGQLGLHVARVLTARGARVGLVGRKAPVPDLVVELNDLGIAWATGDVSDQGALDSALAELRSRLGPFTGVVHAAGVLRDGLAMAGIAEDDAAAVLAPKIAGAEHLDALTRDDPLEHFVLFSSATGSLGNVGQGVYGYANGWLDGFATARSGPGRTISIGWPLWADGGMRGDTVEAARHGVVPLSTDAGLAAFGAALASDASHVVVLHGATDKLRDGLGFTRSSEATKQRHPVASMQATAPVGLTIRAPAVHRAGTAPANEPIAVIGLAGRYPGAKDLATFWRNLADGVDAVTEVPKDRWDHAAYFDASGETPGTSWSRWGGFIDGVDQFDPLFFHIVPREARVMDPQERLFLETAWAAMEDASIARETLAGRKIGVFAGVMWSQYQLYGQASAKEGSHLLPMSFNASVANRVSHALDLRGPSLSLDTACSSSLSALHLAIESLRRGECELAFAGGVNLTLHPSKYQFLGQGRMLSRDGRCRAFGEGGDGYVPGEGVGVALLKPLSQAQADGDPVWGVILASGISHGGRTAGYTVPSAGRQQELIREVLSGAAVKPTEVSYIEAHGTGTALGDPIEVEGLKGAFGATAAEPWCALGSVKSNIGHLESAAGIAGLTKVLLQLRHRQLAPTLHADPLNSHLAIAGTPFRVQDRLTPWHADGRRIAGLSSFGAGGANAHLLIGEAADEVRTARNTTATSSELMVLSARTPAALRQRANDLLQWIGGAQHVDNTDVLAALTAEAAATLDVAALAIDVDEEWDGLGLHGDRLEIFRARVEVRLDRSIDGAVLSPCRTLRELASRLGGPSGASDCDIAALAHTLQVGRSALNERMAFIAGDEDELRAGLQNFLAGKEPMLDGPAPLMEAARRFLAGDTVDWNGLRPAPHPKRIGSLPAYPFERRSMWVTATPFAGAAQEPLPMRVASAALIPATIAPPFDDILLVPRWRRESGQASSELSDRLWIVAAPEQRQLAMAFAGERPNTRLLSWDEATENLQLGDAVADLCLVAGGPAPLLALMRLLQAIARTGSTTHRRFRLITVGAHTVLPGERADPRQAGLGAFLRSALREMPGTSAACIDLGVDDNLDVAIDETCVPLPHEVAWRRGARFRRRLHPLDLPVATNGLKHGGRYLISGGAGRVGIALATELARRFAARTVLVGRRQADADIAQALASISHAGGTAFYISADIADPAGAHHTVDRAAEKLGGLDGVIHAAAVYDERPLASLTEQDLAAALRPKLDGLHALAAACRHHTLDGFMVFSSAQIHAGNSGRAHYAAACAATDAAALNLATNALWPVRIVNWGFWDAGEVGTEVVRTQLAAQGAAPLSAVEAVEALTRVLDGPATQVAALRLDPAMRPFLGVDDSERWRAVAPAAPSDFAVLRSLAVEPDHDGRVAACRVSFEAVNHHALNRVTDLLLQRRLFGDAKAIHTGEQVAAAISALPRHRRLIDAALAHLLEAGWLRRVGDGFAQASAWPAASKTANIMPADMTAHLRLLDNCFDALPNILAGRVPATDVMFPDGSPALVEGIYRGNPAADWFNRQAATAMATLARAQRDRGETHLRIVEIGAGSGGTSTAVLAALDALAGDLTLDYVFTDVSPAFLKEGRRRLATGRPWLSFRQLDIESDPAAQSFVEGGCDMVLAANVLHATRRIGRSLGHVTRLLRPGGVLVANEAVAIEPFTTFTFGLLDGWWMSEDADMRLPNGPLLSPDDWRAAFADAGFADARVLPGPATTPALDAMRVMVAVSGGIAPRMQTPAAASAPAAMPSQEIRARAYVVSDDGDRRHARIEQRVAAEIASALEFEASEIDATTPFAGLGIDSILAVEASRRINAGLGIALRSTDLFNFADVRRLAAHIASAFPDCMAETEVERIAPPAAVMAQGLANPIAITAKSTPDRARNNDANMPIAIIGMSGRFPDADDLDAFWANLESGHDAVREIPPGRWPLDGFYDPARPDRSSGKWGGFLSNIDSFDPAHFQMSPREAELTDPQHRLFLMESVRALEDAGLTRATLDGSRLGIFVGCKTGDYFRNLGADDSNAQAFTGNANAILPARLAYHLNTVGPTLAVDTACSSALVALHLAVQSLRAGECATAIAGAVALMATPHTHLMLSRASMLSPTGRCRAFDAAADGFVPGEGVGVVVLKPLERAIADGDPIHGVIRASAINQDGRTSSIMAPSAPSQTRLISECYAQAGIDPASIGYIEAHGTGTKLGDPIEAAALTDAFAGRVPADWRGTLGSVKSMLGHTMEAAGMAGLFKVLLMLRHRRQAPSLHFAQPNEHIDFASLPFGVLTGRRVWAAPAGGAPRRAAVSAFGFSGTNAHVVIDEAPPRARHTEARRPTLAFFVSARTADSLRQRCRELADWLDRNRDIDLVALSATLMLGRDHHGHRAAVCGTTAAELIVGWKTIAEGKVGNGIMLGAGGEVRSEPALLELGKLLIERINDPTLTAADYRDKLAALADLYVKGYALRFETLFGQGRPVFLRLPPYPFDLRRCWIDAMETSATVERTSAGLLGEVDPSASLGDGLVFRSRLAADHWVLAQHKVRGRSLLPAAAFLALAVEAGRRVLGPGAVSVSDVRWRQALYADANVKIVTTVSHDGTLTVATQAGTHMQCRVTRASGDALNVLDLVAIRAGMTHTIDGAEFYARCAASGLAFGERFRRVQSLEGNGSVAVSRILAHAGMTTDGLDAGLLDAVLQTVGGRLPATTLADGRAVMPATLDRMEVYGSLPAQASAVARVDQDGRFSIDVVDDHGRIAMVLSGLAFVELAAEATMPNARIASAETLDIYLPHWLVDESRHVTKAVVDSVAILGGAGAPQLVAALRRLHPQAEFLTPDVDPVAATLIYDLHALDPAQRDVLSMTDVGEVEAGAVRLMHLLQRLDGRQTTLRIVTDCVHAIGNDLSIDPRGAAVLGFAKAAAREMSSCDIAAVDIDLTDDADSTAALLVVEPAHGQGEDIAIRHGVRFRRSLISAELPAATPPFRQGGTYLIVGGSGGLGNVLSLHLARHFGAKLAWIGRRPEDDVIRAGMQELRTAGGEAMYVSADVTDAEALGHAVKTVKARFGVVHGVVHSALVLRDALVAGLSEADLRAVLAPKTRGIAALDAVVKDEALDFFAVFSSAIAFSGNAGQANYAAASLFVDAFAAQLRRLRPYSVTVIDWGYWGEVGVVADAVIRRRMQAQGILSISPDAGMDALTRVLGAGVAQAMPIRLTAEKRVEMADPAFVRRRVGAVSTATLPYAEFPPLDDTPSEDFYAALNRYARRKVGHVLRFALPAEGQSAPLSNVRRKLSLAPDQELLFAALLDMLVREGIATVGGDRIDVLGFPEAEPPTNHTKVQSHLPLLDACLDGLVDVLAGRKDAAQVLFPGGSRHLVEAIYSGNAVMAACDTMLARLAADFVARCSDAKLRILEIGGGTGAASRPVLAALAPFGSRLTYVFTDISRSFVARAETELGAIYPFAQFAPLDIAVVPDAQGFEAGTYDLVIASNVLHAVGDLTGALGHAKSLLRPGGLLLINEVTTVIDFVTLTFGLTPGWWEHRGRDGRLPHAPLLSAARWQDRLAAEGFGPVAVFGPPGVEGAPPQAIIAAIGDGWARHPVSGAAKLVAAFDEAGSVQALSEQTGDTALAFVRRVFARVLRMTEAELNIDATFETFGVDSLLVIDLNRAFEAELGRVPATILYEARTLRHLAQRLAAEFGALPAAPMPVKRQQVQAATRRDPGLSASMVLREAATTMPDEAIAVIGMACRFPGAENIEAYWSLLRDGRSAIGEIPIERWDWQTMPAGTRTEGGRHYSRWGGFIVDADAFDPLFFGISPQEAETLDPQERLFLQTAWHALEDGGYPPPALKGRAVGVFVGAMNAGYEWLSGRASAQGHSGDAHSAYWSIANRVSYAFDLQGPSMAVDTACSSSLTALHLACDALRRGDCEAAIVGGVNVIAGPVHYARLCGLGMLSEGPECRSFGDRADGFVDGEGVGAVLLKPLSQALADGDQIHGVIRASAVNAGGKTGGYTVPNPAAQTEVVARALQRAGLSADAISYVEAHGTGTLLGDPIELAGLNAAFHKTTQAVGFCALGSVKSNIGHLESAAGIAGLIKVLLMLKHRTLVPTLHAEPANPKLALHGSPFRLQNASAHWDAPLRRAGISSFGAGGANAHVIVEQVPPRVAGIEIEGPQLIVLSADDVEQLTAQARALRAWLAVRSPQNSTAVASVVAEVLGVAEAAIDPNLRLHELGLDAGNAVRLAALLHERLGLDVSVEAHATLAMLSHGTDTAEPLSLTALAFSLQTGRAPLTVRFAAMVDDVAALMGALDVFVERRAAPTIAGDGRWPDIGRRFLAGEAIDFRGLWLQPYPERLSLPPYAFRRERYWIPELTERPPVDLKPVVAKPAGGVTAPAVIRFPSRQHGARVAVIGAGPSGLVAVKSLREDGHDPVLFERSDRIGGVWAQRRQAPYGTYRSTRLQSSKYTALFSDFPADDDMPVFPGVPDLETYFNAYVDRFDLRQAFNLSATVLDVAADGDGWRLRHGSALGETEEMFDAVALCPGLFGKPKMPDITGRVRFGGRVLHSSEYAEPAAFAGQRVLVVGNGVSGMDIAAELSDVASVSLAVRTPAWVIPRMVGFVPNDCSLSPLRRLLMRGQPTADIVTGWREAMPQFMDAYARSGLMPEHAIEGGLLHVNDRLIECVDAGRVAVMPAVRAFDDNGVVFADGNRQNFDAVIFCTGFQLPGVPFVGGEPADLYKNHFHPAHANMAVIGLYPTTLGCFSTIELGARWFAQILSGKAKLPDRETMRHAVVLDRQRAGAFAADATQPAVVPVDTPVDNIWFAEQIGAFPDPATDWRLYWELLNSPPIPAIYRLQGPHAWDGARAHVDKIRSKLFVKMDDYADSPIADAMLADLGAEVVRDLVSRGQIGAAQAERVLRSIPIAAQGGVR